MLLVLSASTSQDIVQQQKTIEYHGWMKEIIRIELDNDFKFPAHPCQCMSKVWSLRPAPVRMRSHVHPSKQANCCDMLVFVIVIIKAVG